MISKDKEIKRIIRKTKTILNQAIRNMNKIIEGSPEKQSKVIKEK